MSFGIIATLASSTLLMGYNDEYDQCNHTNQEDCFIVKKDKAYTTPEEASSHNKQEFIISWYKIHGKQF